MSNTNILNLDQDHIYLNLQNENSSFSEPIEARINKTFSQNILNNPSEYYVSMIKAQIPTEYIPLFDFASYCTPAALAGNPPTPLSELAISFQFGSNPPITRYLQYQQYIFPFQPGKYLIYNIDQFVRIVNTTFSLLYTDLIGLYPALTVLGGPPVMTYNPILKIFGIQYPVGYTSNSANPNFQNVKVFLNNLVYNLFDTMPYLTYTNGGILNAQMRIDSVFTFEGSNIINRTNASVLNAPPQSPLDSIVYYQMIQEISSIANLYDISSIIFTSNLPTVPEYLNIQNQNNNVVEFPVLNEISPLPADTDQTLLYLPTAEYRLRNLSSSSPITSIQINVYYQNKAGNLFPIFIPPRQNINIKLLFRRKSYLNSMLYYMNGLPNDEKQRIIEANFIKK